MGGAQFHLPWVSEAGGRLEKSRTAAPVVREGFSEVHGLAVAELGDLLAATEAVGNDEGEGAGGLDGRQKAVVGDGLGDLEFICFEAEGSGHAATAGLDGFDGGSRLTKQRDLAGRAAEDGFVVAMTVDKNVLACQATGEPAFL